MTQSNSDNVLAKLRDKRSRATVSTREDILVPKPELSEPLESKNNGVADYGYDFNFIGDRKTYTHRTFDIFKIAFSYLDSATPLDLTCCHIETMRTLYEFIWIA